MSQINAVTQSALTWFEIPTVDFERARAFYDANLETTLRTETFGPARIALPYERPGIGGCLDEGSASRPSQDGVVVYLDATGRLAERLEVSERTSYRDEKARCGPPLATSARSALTRIRGAVPDALVVEHVDTAHSARAIRPLGLYFWGKIWTVASWCELRADFRTFLGSTASWSRASRTSLPTNPVKRSTSF